MLILLSKYLRLIEFSGFIHLFSFLIHLVKPTLKQLSILTLQFGVPFLCCLHLELKGLQFIVDDLTSVSIKFIGSMKKKTYLDCHILFTQLFNLKLTFGTELLCSRCQSFDPTRSNISYDPKCPVYRIHYSVVFCFSFSSAIRSLSFISTSRCALDPCVLYSSARSLFNSCIRRSNSAIFC